MSFGKKEGKYYIDYVQGQILNKFLFKMYGDRISTKRQKFLKKEPSGNLGV